MLRTLPGLPGRPIQHLQHPAAHGGPGESLDIVRKGGRVLWAGGGIRGGIVAPVDTYKVVVKELDIRGEISQIPYDWKTAIHLVATGRV